MSRGAAAYAHAIQGCVTGKLPHADKAIEILNAYAGTLKSKHGGETEFGGQQPGCCIGEQHGHSMPGPAKQGLPDAEEPEQRWRE